MVKRSKAIEPFYKNLIEMERTMGPELFGNYLANLMQSAEILARPYLGEVRSLMERPNFKTIYWIFHALKDRDGWEVEGGIPSDKEILERAIEARDYSFQPETLRVSLDDLASEPALREKAEQVWASYQRNYPNQDFGRACLKIECPARSYAEIKDIACNLRDSLRESNFPLDAYVFFDEGLDEFIAKTGDGRAMVL